MRDLALDNAAPARPPGVDDAPPAANSAQRETPRIAQLINHLATFFVMLDADGRVTAIDPRISTRLGLSESRWLGSPVWELPFFAQDPVVQSILIGAIYERDRARRSTRFETLVQPLKGPAMPLLWHVGQIQQASERVSEFVVSATDITGQEKIRRALARSNALLDAALIAGGLGVYEFYPDTEEFYWSATLRKIWGVAPDQELTADAIFSDIHPDDRPGHLADLQQAMTLPGPGRHNYDFRFWHAPSQSYRWMHADGQVTFRGQRPERMIGVVADITDKRRNDEQREILIHELNHRVKNIFGIMLGMISMTARTTDSTAEMADELRARVTSMARAHDTIRPAITLEDAQRPAVDLRGLIDAVVAPHLAPGHTLDLTGPEFDLRAHGTTSLALLLHELTTNAVKYGALRYGEGGDNGVTQGRLSIHWERRDNRLLLQWVEDGGSPVSSVGSDGFGSRLIELTVKLHLNGTLERDWDETGLTVRIDVPLERVSA